MQDLPADRGPGIGVEAHAAVGIEAVDRVDQADRAHLHDVVMHLASWMDVMDTAVHQREVGVDRLVAELAAVRRSVGFATEATEELVVG
ncbi:MAG: hypothetical protein NVSMB48_02820 [Marmoricola sp.]